MIPGTASIPKPSTWQNELAEAITDPAELLTALGLGDEWLPNARAAARLFPLRVPRGFVERMRRADPYDPLLRQVLPLGEECVATEGYGADPVGDVQSMVAPGVLHKYQGRVLLTTTGACAVHCRYCFRRHFDYADANPAEDGWRAALSYVERDVGISEVILSGGDPLSLSDRRLTELLTRLEGLGHIRRVRVHTRAPIVVPARVTDELCRHLLKLRLAVVVVLHANHSNEIDVAVRAACARLRATGVTLLNQSVLLRGVNDNVEALAQLSDALFSAQVLPYYLHMLDRVQGAAHFSVDDATARVLHTELQARLPGYLVPRLVKEVKGAANKLAL